MKLVKHWKRFVDSFFNLDTRFLLVFLADVLFVIFVTAISQVIGVYFQSKVSSVPTLMQFASSNATSINQVNQYAKSLQNLVIIFIASTVLYIFLLLVSWTASQGFVWNTINKKQHTFKYYVKLFLMNLFLVPLFILVFLLTAIVVLALQSMFKAIISSIAYNGVLVIATSLLLIVLVLDVIILYVINSLNLVYYNFSLTRQIRKSFSKMFGQLPKLGYIPIVFMSLVVILLAIIATLFRAYYFFALVVLLLLALAWMRFYAKELIEAR